MDIAMNELPIEQSKSEKRDRFDEFMRSRHDAAVTGLKVEEALSYVDSDIKLDDYPTSRSPDNVYLRTKAEEVVDKFFKDKYPAKKRVVLEAIQQYIAAKVRADRFQLDLGIELEDRGIRQSGLEAGRYLFEKQTKGVIPHDRIMFHKDGGYIILTFYDREDYLAFTGRKKEDESGGLFHHSMHFPTLGTADFILIPRDPTSSESNTIKHERQHFINRSAFSGFEGVESSTFSDAQKIYLKEYPHLSKAIEDTDHRGDNAMREVKNELLACIREPGRSLSGAVSFWDFELYDHLRTGMDIDEQKDMALVLRRVKSELIKIAGLFEGDQARGLLIYHLIDIPLIKFPERIEAVARFYKKRMDRVTKYIPREMLTEGLEDNPERDRLTQLSMDIIGESYSADSFALGLAGDNLDEQDVEIENVVDKLKKLRREYDELLARTTENKVEA